MKTCLKVLILALALDTANCQEWMSEVKSFLIDNGLKYVTLLGNSTIPSPYARKIISNLFEKADFHLRHSGIERYTELHQIFDVDVQIFLFDPKYDEIGYLLKVIQRTKVERSILLSTRPWKSATKKLFKSHLNDTPNLFFYVASPLDSSLNGALMSWQQVITLMTGYTINDLKFRRDSYTIKEQYDFNGLTVRSTSLTWAPFLTINDCNDDGTDCAIQYGYLMDYMDALAKDLNFTFESYIDLGRHLMEL